MRKNSGITLEQLGLSPSVNPMEFQYSDDWFQFPGFFRQPAHTAIRVYSRNKVSTDTRAADSSSYVVVIATELDANKGVSITNGSESLAKTICDRLHIRPEDLILIEHYEKDSILDEHYDLVKFEVRRGRAGLEFTNREWFPLDADQLERLIGAEVV